MFWLAFLSNNQSCWKDRRKRNNAQCVLLTSPIGWCGKQGRSLRFCDRMGNQKMAIDKEWCWHLAAQKTQFHGRYIPLYGNMGGNKNWIALFFLKWRIERKKKTLIHQKCVLEAIGTHCSLQVWTVFFYLLIRADFLKNKKMKKHKEGGDFLGSLGGSLAEEKVKSKSPQS